MKVTHIPFKQTGFFSKTMIDYLEQKSSIKPFYNKFPDIEGFRSQIKTKKKSFSIENRKILVEALKNQ